MVSIYCPHCHQHTLLNERVRTQHRQWSDRIYFIGECNNCFEHVLVYIAGGSVRRIFPDPQPRTVDSRVPASIKKDFEEANICFSVGAFRASAVMVRRALQSICLDKGAAENDKLIKQIDWLFSQGIITKDLKEWAHEVRLVGNDAAHPKKPHKDAPITKDDAEEILQLLEQFTQTLYVAPAIAAERKKLRTEINKEN